VPQLFKSIGGADPALAGSRYATQYHRLGRDGARLAEFRVRASSKGDHVDE
jgi:hypothetical protein